MTGHTYDVALSIRQPWAWLILHGGKDVENRVWPTTYRGRLWIHAPYTTERNVSLTGYRLPSLLPVMCLLGTVQLIDCRRDSTSPWAEPDRWHWILTDPRPLPEPVPYPGARGLWSIPASLVSSVKVEIS
jgi:ASCH domain